MQINKKIGVVFFTLVLLILFINLIKSEDIWPNYNMCCEKLKSSVGGAWCQNSIEANCDAKYRKTPTSCESTSFCKKGCCVDTGEGLCMENTPEKVCETDKGSWFSDATCNIDQCNLGCCVLGDQAAYVTLTRCKKLSGFYGLTTDFKREISDEISCIAVAHSQDKGACVYEFEGSKTCKMTTRAECTNVNISTNNKPDFYKDYLCTADELSTDCGPTTLTMCVPGKEEVYFKDTCGNPANIYDAGKIYAKNPAYWQKIVAKADSCGYNTANANSAGCGNCDYFKGSICSDSKTATYGNYICKDLSCGKINGIERKNGESWCEYQSKTGNGTDVVGSRHIRHLCINGEELIEPCEDYRTKICVESTLTIDSKDFTEAACIANRWQDCMSQTEEKDCLDLNKRDCYWSNKTKIINVSCFPDVPPGLKFWDEGEASGVCAIGSTSLEVVYTTINSYNPAKRESGWSCKQNCEVLDNNYKLRTDYVTKWNQICGSLGDCGAKVNVINIGTTDGTLIKVKGTKEESIMTGILGDIKKNSGVTFTGKVVLEIENQTKKQGFFEKIKSLWK
jgi:hypothetical protein